MRLFHADKAVPPAPLPQDKGGWRVAPAPDGRGMPEEHKPPRRIAGGASGSSSSCCWRSTGCQCCSPAFGPAAGEDPVLTVLPVGGPGRPGQVDLVEGRHDQGTFTTKVRYPPGDAKATPTTLFSTQVPAFWNNNALTALLQQHNVQVNAAEPESGDFAAGGDPARVRADAAARGPVRAVGAARPGRRRRPGRARQFRPLAGAAGRPGEDPGDVR